jgi:hypothetical protein
VPPAVRYCLIAVWVVGVIVITGGLIYFPALALPIFGVVGHDEEVVGAIELRPLPVLELTSFARALMCRCFLPNL